jgi:3-hydroxyacyl-CoA dehydrogenase/enoyl-CoA hydratase/3-hydroxybutyryl-CoA epimerase
VKGEQTSDETIARAFDFIRLIKKIPIIVKDSWGFYSGRVRNTYILEGIAMLLEGYSPALIENLGLQTGMPMGPLAMADDLGLEMVLEYETQAAELYGAQYVRHPAAQALSKMIDLRRTGRQNYAGFYEYSVQNSEKNINLDEPQQLDRQLWRGLTQAFPSSQQTFDREALTERLLFAQVLEAAWCLQEGIIQSAAEANLASIYGWKFPAGKGGLLQYANDYGLVKFIEKCKFYKIEFGQRFRVPKLLREMAIKNEVF